jgi:predicted HicB family RNase H-like nuclease
MTYKGYTARIEYGEEDGCLIGRVLGIRDIITFHGNSVKEMQRAFMEAIDFYLETEANPQKPFSGKFNLRIPPELHAKASLKAEESGKSLNQWVSEAIDKALTESRL